MVGSSKGLCSGPFFVCFLVWWCQDEFLMEAAQAFLSSLFGR